MMCFSYKNQHQHFSTYMYLSRSLICWLILVGIKAHSDTHRKGNQATLLSIWSSSTWFWDIQRKLAASNSGLLNLLYSCLYTLIMCPGCQLQCRCFPDLSIVHNIHIFTSVVYLLIIWHLVSGSMRIKAAWENEQLTVRYLPVVNFSPSHWVL